MKAVISQLHAANVSVLFPWNQWASGNLSFGSRAEPDFDFVQLLAEVAADGFNTDSGGRSAIPGQKGYKPIKTIQKIKSQEGDTRREHDKISTRTRRGFAKTRTAGKQTGGGGAPPKGGFQ